MSTRTDGPLAAELDALRASIEHEAGATATLLSPEGLDDADGALSLPGHTELHRQLGSLHDRLDRAVSATDDPREVRAELATLLFFARTLRRDARAWRAGLRQAIAELGRREAAARREQARLAAERAELMGRRAALQVKIDQEADRIAYLKHGECRRTVPVITLHPGLTISSMTVSSARRRFRSLKLWLVTLDEARHDILVRSD